MRAAAVLGLYRARHRSDEARQQLEQHQSHKNSQQPQLQRPQPRLTSPQRFSSILRPHQQSALFASALVQVRADPS